MRTGRAWHATTLLRKNDLVAAGVGNEIFIQDMSTIVTIILQLLRRLCYPYLGL